MNAEGVRIISWKELKAMSDQSVAQTKMTLVQLRDAMSTLTELWERADDELDEVLSTNYPFAKSFDELHLELVEWTDAVIERIDAIKASRKQKPTVDGKSTVIKNVVVDFLVEDETVDVIVTAEYVALHKNGQHLRSEDVQDFDTYNSMLCKLKGLGLAEPYARHVLKVINEHLAMYDMKLG